MADWGQFEEVAERAGIPASCQVCEAMLPDAVDGTLSEPEQRAFDRHVAGCVVCARELEEARRGAAWLGMLKQQSPEPSALLLQRILAQTTGAEAAGVQAVAMADVMPTPVWASLPSAPEMPAVPARPRVRVATAWQTITGSFSLDWMRPMLQPRLAMTAAMAFFSVALTLNLTGVRLSAVSTAALHPSTLRRTVADRSAAVVRGFQNIPVVYQAEARMSDLRSGWQQQGDEPAKSAAPDEQQDRQQDAPKQQQPAPEKPQGSSRLEFVPINPQQAGMARKGA